MSKSSVQSVQIKSIQKIWQKIAQKITYKLHQVIQKLYDLAKKVKKLEKRVKYWNAWYNYLLTSLVKYCNQGDSDLKNATLEIILTSTSNKVSGGGWRNQAGEVFSIILHFFIRIWCNSAKKLFHLINALHYPIWHQHCRKVTIWGNPSLF
jgi:hypothetical protein